jgi:hypothetical protein
LARAHAFYQGNQHDGILPYGVQVGGLKVELGGRLQGVNQENNDKSFVLTETGVA